MTTDPYKRLAEHLDALPNGFPATEDGRELRILRKLFAPDEAVLAAELTSELQTADEVAGHAGGESAGARDKLKSMARRGLIGVGRDDGRLGFKLLPFVVGFYEMQNQTMDAEFAHLFEDYFMGGFGGLLGIEPHIHRVVPAHKTVDTSIEVQPYESVKQIVYSMQSWGVQDCVCRKQQSLIGHPCHHPVEVCLAMDPHPGTFDDIPGFRALTRDEAMAVLHRCSEAGLVHTVTNSMEGTSYICNCCTCGCGILRGMADLGLANVVASSPFINEVQPELCDGCELCLSTCQFDALTMNEALAQVDEERCIGCGVCVINCARDALVLVRRPAEEVKPIPRTPVEWGQQRLAARGL